MGNTLRRIPSWAWLTAIVVGSAVFRAALGRGIVAPFIMVDEIIWSELARGIAEAGEPLLRGEADPGYSIVYPIVLSPIYLIFDSLPDAYAAVKVLNAVLMSLAAVPAFFLARRVVRDGLALLAALLTVAVPSLAYTGTVMTENVFYPLFLVVVLVLVLVLEQPTPTRVATLLALLVLALATRVQAVALLPAVAVAPLVLALFERRGLRSVVWRFRWLYAPLAAIGVGALVLQAVVGRSPQDLLGAYSPVGEVSYVPWDVVRHLWWHVAELSLYLAVIPLAATIVLVGQARSLDAGIQAFLAATVTLSICLVPVVAAFASAFSFRIEERNLFYLAPLFCIALLAWVERGAPRPRTLATVAGLVSGLLVVAVPLDRFLTTSAITDTLMLLPLWSLEDRIGDTWIRIVALAAGLALAAVFLVVPRRIAVVLPVLVLGLWALAIRPIWWGTHGFERFSRGALFQGIRAPERDWIDRALPDGAHAAFLWTGRTDRLTVNQNEFFSRQVGPVYYLGSPTPGELPETRITIDRKTGEATLPDGAPVRDDFLVADASFEPDGEPLAQDDDLGITLWRVSTPLVSAVDIDGLYPDDTWSGPEVTYLRWRCAPGRIAVWLSSDASLFLDPQRVVARSNGRVVARVRLLPEGKAVLRVPVTPAPGTSQCRIDFTVTPTAVPAEVFGGESQDTRELGAHFNRFVYERTP